MLIAQPNNYRRKKGEKKSETTRGDETWERISVKKNKIEKNKGKIALASLEVYSNNANLLINFGLYIDLLYFQNKLYSPP